MTKKKGPDSATLQAALAVRMRGNDADAKNVREYLRELLRRVWTEGEGFSGKRPFGNSGWTHDLYAPLVKGGFIKGTLVEDDYAEEVEGGEEFVLSLIDEMCKAPE